MAMLFEQGLQLLGGEGGAKRRRRRRQTAESANYTAEVRALYET